jgi:tetratricopeptide (TPR) repeat protein
VLSNLAKVHAERKDTARVMELLRRAIDLDPNQDNGLLWWVALHREQGGDAAAQSALRAAADRPGAWRPQLWLAREHLKRGEVDAAVSLYQHVLARAAGTPDVLMMISGDLGNAGQLDPLVRLVAPVYDPEKHGPHAGFNLIEAFKQLRRFDEARAVLGKLQAERLAPFAEHLARIEQSLAEARIAAEGPASIPAVGTVVFEDPIWTRGLFNPSWLLPRRATDGPLLTVFALANGTLTGSHTRPNLPDVSSRFSRALALYLAERLRFDLEIATRCVLFAAPGKGVVVFGEISPVPVLAPTAREQGRTSYGLSGIVQQDSVRFDLWDASSQATESFEIQGSVEGMGDWVKAIESAVTTRVRGFARVATAAADPFTARPPDALVPGYCSALDQLVYQLLAANKITPADSLFNERAMFESYLSLAEAWGDAGLRGRMLATCGVVAAVQYGSSVVPTYARIVQRWYESAGRETQLGMLAPAVLLRIGAREAFEAAMARVGGIADKEYVAWLERVRAEASRP